MIKKLNILSEFGHSMVEMLGVLAVIGVLSISGIMGYNYAISKHRSNTIINELNLRTIPLFQLVEKKLSPETPLKMEMGNIMETGHPIQALVSKNSNYFEVHIDNVQSDICEFLLKEYRTPSFIMVGNPPVLYEGNTNICQSDTNNNLMIFVFNNNLSGPLNCTQRQGFDLETYACECPANSQISPDGKDCLCPAGYIWNNNNECVEQRCEKGYFETLKSGCVPCDTPDALQISNDASSIAMCEACSRTYHSDKNQCSLPCISGKEFFGTNNLCRSCDDLKKSAWINASDTSKEWCNACDGAHSFGLLGFDLCIRDSIITSGQTFGGFKDLAQSYEVFNCDETSDILIGNLQTTLYLENKNSIEESWCTACDRSIETVNKSVNDHYIVCRKKTCNETEFKGADGACYSCTDPKGIAVNSHSGCTAVSCGRTEENGICKITTCGEDSARTSDGSCYSCEETDVFPATEAECSQCSETHALMTTSWGYTTCRRKNCIKGEQMPYAGTTHYLCHPCSQGDGTTNTGNTSYAIEMCTACNGYIADDKQCYIRSSCIRGEQFRSKTDNYRFCTSCDYVGSIKMAGHEEHNKMCADCVTTPRFFADNYCYRCDTHETPIVVTNEEINSCYNCKNRYVNQNGQCIPKTSL